MVSTIDVIAGTRVGKFGTTRKWTNSGMTREIGSKYFLNFFAEVSVCSDDVQWFLLERKSRLQNLFQRIIDASSCICLQSGQGSLRTQSIKKLRHKLIITFTFSSLTGQCEGRNNVRNFQRHYGVHGASRKPNIFWQYEPIYPGGSICDPFETFLSKFCYKY